MSEKYRIKRYENTAGNIFVKTQSNSCQEVETRMQFIFDKPAALSASIPQIAALTKSKKHTVYNNINTYFS